MKTEIISLELTPEEIEKKKKESDQLAADRKKASYLEVNEPCPFCNHYPLEEQGFGYERSVFCPNCSYQRMEKIE